MKDELGWDTRLTIVKGLLKDLETEVKELEKIFNKYTKTTNIKDKVSVYEEKQQEAR